MLRMAGVAFAVGALVMGSAMADVSLASVFGDSMVLQRDKAIPVWGKAAANESIVVSLGRNTTKTKADAQGRMDGEAAAHEGRRSV